MKKLYILFVACFLCLFSSCEEILKEVDFSVTTTKTSYTTGEEVVFTFENAPDWVTFFSGEEGHIYPAGGQGIKSIVNNLITFKYSFNTAGTYEIVFLGGNTNYEGSKTQEKRLTLSIAGD